MASTMDQLVIKQRRPLRGLFLLLLGIITGAGALGIWLYIHQTEWEKQLSTLQAKHQQVLVDNQRLQQQNTRLSTALTGYDQQVATQKAMSAELEQRLKDLQDQVIDLSQELTFYQNITQGNSSSELQVREFELRKDGNDPDAYRYRLVVTQGKNIKEAIQGQITLAIIAGDDNREIARHDLNLRYVQVVEGQLSLSADMQPEKVAVRLSDGNTELASREFDWQVNMPLTP